MTDGTSPGRRRGRRWQPDAPPAHRPRKSPWNRSTPSQGPSTCVSAALRASTSSRPGGASTRPPGSASRSASTARPLSGTVEAAALRHASLRDRPRPAAPTGQPAHDLPQGGPRRPRQPRRPAGAGLRVPIAWRSATMAPLFPVFAGALEVLPDELSSMAGMRRPAGLPAWSSIGPSSTWPPGAPPAGSSIGSREAIETARAVR